MTYSAQRGDRRGNRGLGQVAELVFALGHGVNTCKLNEITCVCDRTDAEGIVAPKAQFTGLHTQIEILFCLYSLNESRNTGPKHLSVCFGPFNHSTTLQTSY